MQPVFCMKYFWWGEMNSETFQQDKVNVFGNSWNLLLALSTSVKQGFKFLCTWLVPQLQVNTKIRRNGAACQFWSASQSVTLCEEVENIRSKVTHTALTLSEGSRYINEVDSRVIAAFVALFVGFIISSVVHVSVGRKESWSVARFVHLLRPSSSLRRWRHQFQSEVATTRYRLCYQTKNETKKRGASNF